MAPDLLDRLAIREGLENWVLWRDSGDWDRFATIWHDDGFMVATWFQAPASEFMARSRAGFENGLTVFHVLGACAIDLLGDRAVVQTRMEIIQRAPVHDVVVDVNCHGRFYDAWEKRKDRWGLVHRNVVYELDRMTPVDPGAQLELDPDLLGNFPEGYRHLGYLQTHAGMHVSRDLPGTRGPQIAALRERMERWKNGAPSLALRGMVA
jgi:hypothetical protein